MAALTLAKSMLLRSSLCIKCFSTNLCWRSNSHPGPHHDRDIIQADQRIRVTEKNGNVKYVTTNEFHEVPRWQQRIVNGLGKMVGANSSQTLAIQSANFLYGTVSLPLEKYPSFFIPANTVQSWFSIIHLHVYLLMVRLRSEGEQGQRIISSLVESLVDDLEVHIRQVGITSNSIIGKSVKEFLSQFYGRTLAYDEGITGSDMKLAAALWRNYFALDTNISIEILEKHVRYMREQLCHLDKIPGESLLKGHADWSASLLRSCRTECPVAI